MLQGTGTGTTGGVCKFQIIFFSMSISKFIGKILINEFARHCDGTNACNEPFINAYVIVSQRILPRREEINTYSGQPQDYFFNRK
jgi:hypothetical protein